MNMDSWNKLPKDVQKVMNDMGREQAKWTGEYMDKHVDHSIAWSKENHNIEIIKLSKKEKARWDKLLKPVTTKWIADAKAKGLPAEAIIKDIKAFAKKNK